MRERGSAPPELAVLRPASAVLRAPARSSLTVLLLFPALIFLAIFFAYPMIGMLIRSVSSPAGFTLAQYYTIVTHRIYLDVFEITFEISLVVTVVTLIVGYSLAYALTYSGKAMTGVILGCIVLSMFTDLLVRTYAWMILLAPNGVINQVFRYVRLGHAQLIFNRFAIFVGMTYALLPYMVLTLYSVMRGIDLQLIRAARSLGASGRGAFWHIFLPLSFPGVAGGALLVFTLAMGYFITPALLGGASDQMIAMVIEDQVALSMNWSLASALAVVLLLLTLGGFLLYDRVLGFKSLFESKSY